MLGCPRRSSRSVTSIAGSFLYIATLVTTTEALGKAEQRWLRLALIVVGLALWL